MPSLWWQLPVRMLTIEWPQKSASPGDESLLKGRVTEPAARRV